MTPEPTPEVTSAPVVTPEPTPEVTVAPTSEPTEAPPSAPATEPPPSAAPSLTPSAAPSVAPSLAPSTVPSEAPSGAPPASAVPPSESPAASAGPSGSPVQSALPSEAPTATASATPTAAPPVVQPRGALANPSADLDQCGNGGMLNPTENDPACDPREWVNGNLGPSKAHYLEGDSIPYRLKFDNLGTGATIHTVTIEWDTTKSGTHAIDYLTTYDRTVTTADPCASVVGCSRNLLHDVPDPDRPADQWRRSDPGPRCLHALWRSRSPVSVRTRTRTALASRVTSPRGSRSASRPRTAIRSSRGAATSPRATTGAPTTPRSRSPARRITCACST